MRILYLIVPHFYIHTESPTFIQHFLIHVMPSLHEHTLFGTKSLNVYLHIVSLLIKTNPISNESSLSI